MNMETMLFHIRGLLNITNGTNALPFAKAFY